MDFMLGDEILTRCANVVIIKRCMEWKPARIIDSMLTGAHCCADAPKS